MLELTARWSMRLVAALICLILRERTRAILSTRLGDPTPRASGYLSRNLFKHIEPIGLFLTVYFGFGWGQPTPTSPLYYRDHKRGVTVVYGFTILLNMVVGLASAMLYRALFPLDNLFLSYFLLQMAWVNIATALFNLLPVHPMDGLKILRVFVSPNAALMLVRNEKNFQVAMMFFLILGFLGMAINPLVRFFILL